MAVLASPLTDRRGAEAPVSHRAGKRRSLVAEWFAHPHADFYLVLVPTLLLLALGTMMVLSASSVDAYAQHDGDAYFWVKRQLLFAVVGAAIAFGVSWLSRTALGVCAWIALAAAFVLQLLTFSPLGVDVHHNRNWVQFGSEFARVQPAEFVKIALVLWGADVFARKAKLLGDTRHLLVPFLPVSLAFVAMVMVDGDLGTAILLGAIIVAVLWFVGARWKVLVSMFTLIAIGAAALVLTSPNRMARIFGFANQDADPFGTNHQPIQAAVALASGGWWGVGLGGSRQKWGGLAEAHTDYIFAVTGEELGFVGVLVVLALFVTFGYAGLRIALRSTDRFTRFAAAGVTAWIIIQALVNILVVVRWLPVLGVPLPFLSYGGSAMIANLCGVGVLLACARQEPGARELADRRDRPVRTAVVSQGRLR